MLKNYLRRCLPDHKTVHDNAFMRRFGHWFADPRLWHLNRRSVAGGVAIGLFSGLIPGPLQVITASALALGWRKNLPVAILATFYTNPLTIGPLYWLAFKLGSLLSGATGHDALRDMPSFFDHSFGDWLQLLLSWVVSMGAPLLIGLPVLALSLAVLGYVLVLQGWWLHVCWHVWRKRPARRK